MWILSWKKYSLSHLATFISVIGALTRYGGVLCLFAMLIPAAIVCIALGIGMHFWAEAIAFGKWKKKVESAGYSEKVRQGDVQIAAQLYKANADKKTLKYIESLNPQVAARLKGGAAQTAPKAEPRPAPQPAPQPAPKAAEQTVPRPQPAPAPAENANAAQAKCAHCGSPLPSGSKFCTQCGKPIDAKKKCIRCGATTEANSKFCPECGYKLN